MVYKVMLVDDDYPMVEYLSEAIPWEQLGFQLIGLYENGLTAFEAAQKMMPDILITDIGMPKMDGIELTRRLKQINEHLQVAIISCHDEFSFAQQALKLNVQDYFLKETFDLEELKHILFKCKDRLEKDEQKTKEYATLQFKARKHADLEEQQMFKQYIQGASNQMLSRLKQGNYIPVLFLINHFYLAEKQYGSEETLIFAIQNIIKDIQNDTDDTFIFIHYEDNKGFLLFESSNSIKVDNFMELRNLLRTITDEINRYLHVQISFILGKSTNVEGLKDQCVRLLHNRLQIFYIPLNSMEDIKEEAILNKKSNINMEYFQSVTEKMRQAIYRKDTEKLCGQMEEFRLSCFMKQIDAEIVKEFYIRMILDWRMKTRGINFSSSSHSSDFIQKDMLLMTSIHEIEDYFIQFVHLALSSNEGTTTNKDILNACYYVSKHIDTKFSLDEVADYLYLNPSYFSRLFKKEVGITFIDYVKQQKMERAKELLELSDSPVGSISEQLGYDNQSYFIKIFKRYTGYTPLEYRTKVLTGIGEA